jgi:hypothetical protein
MAIICNKHIPRITKKVKKRKIFFSMFMHQCQCKPINLIVIMIIHDALYGVTPSLWMMVSTRLGVVSNRGHRGGGY